MSAESRFVLEVLQPLCFSNQRPLEMPEFAGDASAWRRAEAFATELHAAAPFALLVLRAPWAARLPAETRTRFEREESRVSMVLALLDAELEAAVAALSTAGIDVIVLKGADISRRAYPERRLRPMGDIDLLVPRKSYHDAWRALLGAGFLQIEPHFSYSFRSALARGHDVASIDLHCALTEFDALDREPALWARSIAADYGGLPGGLRALSAEDSLVYLLQHGAVQHALESPLWLLDLHFLLERTPALDWSLVARLLGQTRSSAAAATVFRLLCDWWRTPVPTEILAALERRAGGLRRQGRRLTRARPEDWFFENPRSRAWLVWSRYLLRENLFEALRYERARRRRKRAERLEPASAAAFSDRLLREPRC